MAAPRATAALLGLVLALSTGLSPAVASRVELHEPHGIAGDVLAGDHLLELLREAAQEVQARPEPPGRPAFTLWPAPPPENGHLFARAPVPPRLELTVPAPSIASEIAETLPETRIRAFGLFGPILHPGSNRVSRENATGYALGLWRTRVGPTQKGLWTDPVTGISYARARWYDARTAGWLSEDPMGDVDSPNLYAFVSWQPSMAIDPLGLDAIAIALPDYLIQVGERQFEGLGHAAIVIVEDEGSEGFTRYYEYGRYDAANLGLVRRVSPIPDLDLGQNGLPTEESLKRLLRELAGGPGRDTRIEAAYFVTDDVGTSKMVEFAEGRLGENQDPGREPYSVLENNCSHFCQDTLEAAGIQTPWQIDPRPASYIQELQEDADFEISYDPESDELAVDQRMFNVNRSEILEWKALPLWKRLFVDPPGEDQSIREQSP